MAEKEPVKVQPSRANWEEGETIFNFHNSPQEFFAWQFDLWASRKMSGDLVQNETFWRKIARYVENIFNRYANDAEIHPDLEPLFSKILPDSERAGVMMGVDANPRGINAEQINLGLFKSHKPKKLLKTLFSVTAQRELLMDTGS